ncbi:hypothetical protein BDD43_2169 [Mucilaginibacter gracilis]|uniref:Uncharacterized protein n=1 Tax=Mucilaginibacter gracilis TaxID=423350 RepID=A0A495J120_9SPHI|nr:MULTISPECIES: hypothetical protein [Mucilaginibacter]RKR82004.1 hypothetical protein BDD43_2169 [Mucilaginibacter gracilis]
MLIQNYPCSSGRSCTWVNKLILRGNSFTAPANHIEPGERTGEYRLVTTNLVFDVHGDSKISYVDYAAALVDEIKNKRFLNQQFSIGHSPDNE